MKKKLILTTALLAGCALADQAAAITLKDTWQSAATATGSSFDLTGESATGFTADVTRAGRAFQLASSGDFTSTAFNIGDTATMSFTTTVNTAATSNGGAFRMAMWDDANGGGASLRLDWGALDAAPALPLVADYGGVGVGDNVSSSAIGSWDIKEFSGASAVPSFEVATGAVDVSYSVTKTGANLFDVTLDWGGNTVASATGISNATSDAMDTISGVGIRLNAGSGDDNNFTISNLAVSVTPVPEPSTTALLAVFGLGLIGRRRR